MSAPADGRGSSVDQHELVELVGQALERIEDGETPDLLELSGGRPEVATAVQRAISTARELPRMQAASATHEPWVGRILLDRYRVEGRLGAGAMGVVYEAFDETLQRPTAIKILRPGLHEAKEARARFEREAEVLASLRHPGIVTLYDRGETEDGEVFLVMELLEGVSLADLLEEVGPGAPGARPDTLEWIRERLGAGTLPEASYLRAAARWVRDLAAGLEVVHAADCYHRDLKPSNVFLCADGRPVLLDFGIAIRAHDAYLTREGSMVGTPAYLAPEVLHGRLQPGAAQDVYGLAATLYHLLTGRPPYSGTPTQVLSALATQDPDLAKKHCPDLPRDLQAILECGMAREPDRRYRTARALEEDLQAFLDYRPVSARPSTWLGRTARRLRRSRAARGALAATLAGVLLLGAVQARSAWRDSRAAAANEAKRHVLVNRTISEYPDLRFIVDEAARAGELARLDAAVEADSSAIPMGLLRAAFRLDHGDPTGAAEDMRRVAAEGGPYARALAARYAVLPPEASDARAVDVEGLPEPGGREDLFVAAYQAFREFRYRDGRELLAREELDGFRPAEELRLIFVPTVERFRDLEQEEVLRRAAAWQDRIVRFEEEIGGRTVLTAHLLGAAMGHQNRWGQALEVIDEAIALAPDAIAHRVNAGRAAWREGRFDEVEGYLLPVLRSGPSYLRPYELLIRSHLDAERLDEAAAYLEQAPFRNKRSDQLLRVELEADLFALRAWQHERAAEREAATDQAAQAVALYDELVAATADSEDPFVVSTRSTLARAIASESVRDVFDALLVSAAQHPTNAARIAVALEYLPDELDESNRESIRDYLNAMHAYYESRPRVTSRADPPRSGDD